MADDYDDLLSEPVSSGVFSELLVEARTLRRRVTLGLAAALACAAGITLTRLDARRLAVEACATDDVAGTHAEIDGDDTDAGLALHRAARYVPHVVPVGGGGSGKPPQEATLPRGVISLRPFKVFHLDEDGLGRVTSIKKLIPPEQIGVISLWATWCEPCRRELPALANAIAGAPWGEHVALLAVAQFESAADIAVYEAGRELLVRLRRAELLIDVDTSNKNALRVQIQRVLPTLKHHPRDFPLTCILDHDGHVRWCRLGEITEEELRTGGPVAKRLVELVEAIHKKKLGAPAPDGQADTTSGERPGPVDPSTPHDEAQRVEPPAEEPTSAPGKQTPTPDKTTPGKQTPAPEQPTPVPNKSTPGKQTPAPAKKTPNKSTPGPAPGKPSSDKSTPGKQTPTPAPEKQAPSSDEPTPGKQTPTPAPEKQTPTSGKQTPTPNSGKQTPDKPTPGNQTPTPDPGKPTPNKPTPGAPEKSKPESPTPTPEKPKTGKQTPTPNKPKPGKQVPGRPAPKPGGGPACDCPLACDERGNCYDPDDPGRP